jgi:phage anti-repressor protein
MPKQQKGQAAIKDSDLTKSSSLNELPIIQQGDNLLIDANLLHKQLKVETRFNDWIKRRIEEFGFKPDVDFYSNLSNQKPKGRGGNRLPVIEVHLTLDMAKELAMLERNEQGRNIRRYFIQKEKEARGISHLPKEAGLFKGIPMRKIFGQQLVLYRDYLGSIGLSTKGSTSSRRTRYANHFVDVDGRLYITQEFALHLYRQKQVMNNRKVLKESASGIPSNFGTQPLSLFDQK